MLSGGRFSSEKTARASVAASPLRCSALARADSFDLQAAADLHEDVKTVGNFHPLVFLLTATILEVNGDALVRIAIYEHVGLVRIMLAVAGAALLFGYGLTVNLAPLEFGQLAGLYIATLFIVWQIINLAVFRTLPSLPIVVGGTLIVAGDLIVTFWQPNVSQ
jgi:small multidrug resistance family-3 protein